MIGQRHGRHIVGSKKAGEEKVAECEDIACLQAERIDSSGRCDCHLGHRRRFLKVPTLQFRPVEGHHGQSQLGQAGDGNFLVFPTTS